MDLADQRVTQVFTEQHQRDKVVEVAMGWLRTPYIHMGRVKGAGADCLTLLAEVFHEAGLIPKIEIEFYPKDWMHHRDAERYLEGLLNYAHEIEGPPQPGDIALWKFGRCFSHGAIVVNWPTIIHAAAGRNVTLEDASKSQMLCFVGENVEEKGKPRELKFFSYWGKK